MPFVGSLKPLEARELLSERKEEEKG